MKKVGANFLILNLVVSIISFCFILNLGVVSANGEISIKGNSAGYPSLQDENGIDITTNQGESVSGLPSLFSKSVSLLSGDSPSSSQIPHGYAGKLLNWFKISTAEGTWGFSASGIIQGAGWALAVYGAVKMVGPMFGLSPEQTNAAATE